ncbi:MAG TPA: AraC family transcriptional regulator [Nevskiaceae bacterium]|nr:AraC family transcriptional regulator [Nevskiaceae bacterium]
MTERSDDAILDTILSAYHLHARITDNMRYCGRWRDSDPQAPAGVAWFHLLGQGSCWLKTPAMEQPIRLSSGDLVVLPRGTPHSLTSTGEEESAGGEASFTTMLCGELSFESATGHPVLEALPDVMVTPAQGSGDAFRHLAELLLSEARQGGFGSRAVMDKLADALFVMSLRHFLSTAETRRGLFAALGDPRLKLALDAMHADPGRDWTVASLAEVAHLSRTVFAERFAETLAETPYQYLTRWRMMQALKLLRDPRLSVAQVADRLGYETDAAFRRSFKRVHGFGPGSFRREARP